MLPRVLEPEVMDTIDEALDYNSMDHADVNRRFIDDLLSAADRHGFTEALNASPPLRILDVGTGTALIPIEFFRRPVTGFIVAVDLAVEMLRLAEINIRQAGLHGHIALEKIDAKEMPYPDHSFDWVISNSIIHHIPEPLDSLREMLRVLRPGGLLFVRDLLRPESDESVERIVRTYAGAASPHQQQLFRQSLHAALTVEEVQALLSACDWPTDSVQATTDRHWTICGCRPE
jgi:ubiquinone/menaquinone biosynthesis C-methylase UbiE